jgi:nitrous oxide reductase accessory protein NosL
MMRKRSWQILLLLFVILLAAAPAPKPASAGAADSVSEQTRCPVCGMFVFKYPNWQVQIHYEKLSETQFFDGMKDMMVFYFDPERFGAPPREAIRDIFVKDYYSLSWISAKEAFFVTGSDIYGPMGHEFIPFANREAAESFHTDHHGREILTFDEITPERVESLRAGQRMR